MKTRSNLVLFPPYIPSTPVAAIGVVYPDPAGRPDGTSSIARHWCQNLLLEVKPFFVEAASHS